MGLSRDTSFLAAGWLFLVCSVCEGSCVQTCVCSMGTREALSTLPGQKVESTPQATVVQLLCKHPPRVSL